MTNSRSASPTGMERAAAFFVARRWWVAALLATLTTLAVVGLTKLDFDDDPRTILRRNDDNYRRHEQVRRDFGADDNAVVIVLSGHELFSDSGVAGLRAVVAAARAVPGISHVHSLADLRWAERLEVPLLPTGDTSAERWQVIRDRAVRHPLAKRQLIADDGRTTLVVAQIAAAEPTVEEMDSLLTQLRAVVQPAANVHGWTAVLAGHPSLRVDNLVGLRNELYRSAAVSTLISGALALLLFRRVAAALVAVVPPALGLLWTLGALGGLGEHVNSLSSAIPTIVFVIGFTDAVHLLIDYRQGRAAGRNAVEAAAGAIADLGLPCLLTALTTAIGFGSLVLAQTEAVQRFGLLCGTGALLTFVAVLLTLPLLVSFPALGDRVLRQRAGATGEQAPAWLLDLIAPVLRHPRRYALVAVVATLVMARSPFQFEPDIIWTEAIPPESETAQGMRQCDEALGGALEAQVLITWPAGRTLADVELLDVTAQVEQAFAAVDLQGASSVRNLLAALPPAARAAPEKTRLVRGLFRSLSAVDDDLVRRVPTLLELVPPEALARMVRGDLRQLLVTAHVPNVGAAALVPVFDRLQDSMGGGRLAEIARAHPGFDLHLTGTVVIAARNVNSMVSDLGSSLGFEAVAVFLLMAVGFRSFYLGVMSMIPNLFPLLVTASLLVWTGQKLTLTAAMSFNLCLGLAVDDTIHFLLRLERERRVDGDLRAAMIRTFNAIGVALITTTPILIGGFATMLFSEMPAIRLFAQLSCVTLLAALVGDLFVLPALLLSLARPTRAPEVVKAAQSVPRVASEPRLMIES